ncbi:hypothetical protein TSL1_04650 [Sulfurovum sp. TSL1]|nr:hypothetical protein TSL1_04650 [Sulfurovum sp. TSL1]
MKYLCLCIFTPVAALMMLSKIHDKQLNLLEESPNS